MGNIVLLDDLTINKIAAGEVIERPASVIKEMVENSIDAGAKNITVEIKNGGISYIKVTDNGKGIAQDDMEIAFERHATSKIRSADDLNTVTSMGFRGEALASIAAIANVEMISKTQNQDTGYRIVVEAGNVLEKEEAGCPTGTSITVKNLFFNTPVRYKFLKKDYTESGYIEDAITRIALIHPEISIKLINTGKTVIQTNGNGDIKTVIYSIYGKNISDSILKVDYQYEDIKIEGAVGKPEIARSNRSNQLFFVNKRYIKDKTLSAATEQAYKGMIPIGKFGFVILDIEMNPAKVDVNVHPAKLEVRFEEESKIFQAIYHAIKDTLLKADLVSDSQKERVDETESHENGLFTKRNTNNKKISEYINEESKIKTNANENIIEQVYKDRNTVHKTNIKPGQPVNTADILQKLKNIQENLKKEIEKDPNIKINDNYINMIKNEESKKEKNDQQKDEEIVKTDESKEESITTIQKETTEEEKIKDVENEKQEETSNDSNEEININNKKDEKDIQIENQENSINEQETNEKIKQLEEIKEKITQLENNSYQEPVDFDEMYQKLFKTKPISSEKKEEKQEDKIDAIDIIKDNTTLFENIEEYKVPTYKFIGIVFNTYIIIEMNKEMYIIDQHAAHERIMYEKVKKNYYSDNTKDSQLLLLPDIITLTHKEMDIAKENMDMFQKAGFMLEEFGENTIKLTGVPTVCIDLDTKDLFLETLDEINTVARTAKQEKEEKFIATVACKAAVKAHMVLSKEEVESLIDKLLQLPNPFTCPHGRPTAIKMTQYDIERKFARK